MERNTPAPAVSSSVNRRGLYPETEPFAYGWLPTGGYEGWTSFIMPGFTLGTTVAAILARALEAHAAGATLPLLHARRQARLAGFDDALLFTHRGLSGPAVLQISSYWRPGETIVADLAPGTADLVAIPPSHDLKDMRRRGEAG